MNLLDVDLGPLLVVEDAIGRILTRGERVGAAREALSVLRGALLNYGDPVWNRAAAAYALEHLALLLTEDRPGFAVDLLQACLKRAVQHVDELSGTPVVSA